MVIQNLMGIDIKKQKQIPGNSKRTRSLIDNNPIVKILMVSLQLQRPFSFTYDELLGKTRSLLLPFCAIIPAPVA